MQTLNIYIFLQSNFAKIVKSLQVKKLVTFFRTNIDFYIVNKVISKNKEIFFLLKLNIANKTNLIYINKLKRSFGLFLKFILVVNLDYFSLLIAVTNLA